MRHPVFIREIAHSDLAIMLTIVDRKMLRLPSVDSFFVATTQRDIVGGIGTVIDPRSQMTSTEYVGHFSDGSLEDTIGMGMDGMLRMPYWFIDPFKSVQEQVYGL
jgi:hypothetical protein